VHFNRGGIILVEQGDGDDDVSNADDDDGSEDRVLRLRVPPGRAAGSSTLLDVDVDVDRLCAMVDGMKCRPRN